MTCLILVMRDSNMRVVHIKLMYTDINKLINECKLRKLTVSSDREFHNRIAVGKKE